MEIECKRAAMFPTWSCAEKKKKVYECMRKVKTRNNLISFGAAKIDYIFGSSSKEDVPITAPRRMARKVEGVADSILLRFYESRVLPERNPVLHKRS